MEGIHAHMNKKNAFRKGVFEQFVEFWSQPFASRQSEGPENVFRMNRVHSLTVPCSFGKR